ncbi:MAG: FAD-binding oxidoreductase, partial [candidate division Zixibacteria bacterium]|nr:FAD-binding oxidoreductase [candidate division Zixibacteria bacterium]
MSKINLEQRKYLENKFGSRVSFNTIERGLYGHDIAAIPGLIKVLIGKTTPDAVVQPQTEEELVNLVRWAKDNNVPLTPRGKASSGYGGVLPVKNGVVIDFYRMNRILQIDPKTQTVRVQAGVVWEKLDR